MFIFYSFLMLSTTLICCSPVTLMKMILKIFKTADAISSYLVVIICLGLWCLFVSPSYNVEIPHSWVMRICGSVFAVICAIFAFKLDFFILSQRCVKLFGYRYRTKQYELSTRQFSDPPFVFNVSQSLRKMPLYYLIILGTGEEISFRLGVPIIAHRGTVMWVTLTIFGAILFTFLHSIFGFMQILSKVPLAVAGTVLFMYWGICEAILCHVAYNTLYWHKRLVRACRNPNGV